MSTLGDIAEALTDHVRAINDALNLGCVAIGHFYDDPQDDHPNLEVHEDYFDEGDEVYAALSAIKDSIAKSSLDLVTLNRTIKERYAARFDMYGIDVRKEIDLA